MIEENLSFPAVHFVLGGKVRKVGKNTKNWENIVFLRNFGLHFIQVRILPITEKPQITFINTNYQGVARSEMVCRDDTTFSRQSLCRPTSLSFSLVFFCFSILFVFFRLVLAPLVREGPAYKRSKVYCVTLPHKICNEEVIIKLLIMK